MDALALPERDLARLVRTRDVVDSETAAQSGAGRGARGGFAVDEHHVVHHAHLVRVDVGRDRELRELARIGGVGDVDDRRPVRRLHVRDVRGGAADDDLTAARTIEVTNRLDAARVCHGCLPGV